MRERTNQGFAANVSLIETRRVDGRVRHQHIASFGSVGAPPSVEDRLTFWQRLHERLAKLSNRLDATAQAKLLGEIHTRIPMVTLDEQRALHCSRPRPTSASGLRSTTCTPGRSMETRG